MGFLSRIIIASFAILLFSFSSFADGKLGDGCSSIAPCESGYACVGNAGMEGQGTCVASGPQIVLCNIVGYFNSRLAQVFMIFAIVMIGIAFFLGKISWGMIVSVILGMVIIKGSTGIIKRISGQESGYCSETHNLSIDRDNPTCYVNDTSPIFNTKLIYNTDSAQSSLPACKQFLTCTKKKCTNNTSGTLYIMDNDVHTGASLNSSGMFLPSNSNTVAITTCDKNKYETSTNKAVDCPIQNTTCTPIESSPADYFNCKNTCKNDLTGVPQRYEVGIYKTCQEVYAV